MQVPTFERVAIVNRGEPAMRLIHAVREINQEHGASIETVALFTEPDRYAMFVREADHAVDLGPATFVDAKDGQRKSKYLDYEALERALVASGAQAAWVGWGFVAEHAAFADLCKRLGIVFVGPDGDTMRALGDKIASKQLAERAGVPVAPWSGGAVLRVEDALRHADRLGYPLMIKATAGGGGRGIRRVSDASGLREAFDSARAEALKAFGNGDVFLERAVVGARHVEVQIIADDFGTTWAVGVRDCTLQRRNQKVVEEAPCPVLTAKQERDIKAAAVRLARAAGYRNAGTVEFLLDPDRSEFFFMEMNTRLQVEHPVTEVTTGLDLVKLQLLVASGGRLEGEPPPTVGHAIEVRLNAEDADNQFAPAPGKVELFRVATGPGVRVDTGVAEGDEVAPEFDSMVAKLIAHGRDRNEAMGRLRRALFESAVVIRGGTSNRAFLLELLRHPDVEQGRYDIGWLDRTWSHASSAARPHAHVALIQAAIDVYDAEFELDQRQFFASAARGRPSVSDEIGKKVELRYERVSYELMVRRHGPRRYRVQCQGNWVEAVVERRSAFEGWIHCYGKRYRVLSLVDGLKHIVEIEGLPYRLTRDEGGVVRAPAPAMTLAIHVRPGDTVSQGDRLMVLEAMKMEMGVAAPCSGRVREVLVVPNTQVNPGTPLIVIEPTSDSGEFPQGIPISIPADTSVGGDETPAAQCHRVLDELRRLVMGFDIDAQDARRIQQERAALCARLDPDDDLMCRLEESILTMFADLLLLYRRDPDVIGDHIVSNEETMHEYLRRVDSGAKGLPPSFVQVLERTLAHYAVASLDRTPRLDEALLFLHKARQRVDTHVSHISAILERRLDAVDELKSRATEASRDLLDRLAEATLGRYPNVSDLARELRYRLFERRKFEEARLAIYEDVRTRFARLSSGDTAVAPAVEMAALLDCPQPLLGFLAPQMTSSSTSTRRFALELMVRRLYRIRTIESLSVREVDGLTVAAAGFRHRCRVCQVLATHADIDRLPDAAHALDRIAQSVPGDADLAIDVFLSVDGEDSEPLSAARMLQKRVTESAFPAQASRVSVALTHRGDWRAIRYFTFVRTADGFVEDEVQRGIHPMLAERLELWRLENFTTSQLRASDDIYLFHAIAKDNPKDERLFAFVEIRDMTPVRDADGMVQELPHLERMYSEALAGIREYQSKRPPRERLHWNRVLLYVWPTTDLHPKDMMRVAKRLGPLGKNLGLEKAVVRMRIPDTDAGGLRDVVVHVSNRVGTGLRLHIDAPSDKPIRPLSAYAQKVIRMRRLGIVYPYEIVRMLTPSRDTDAAEFPPGDFVEYDLNDADELVPVQRPAGENRANLVVGVIRNFTAKHPEGMTRVIVLGDASREMGALSEPECKRICLAIDLAESMRVPVEWFAVSSGAKIAMDVGTEGLDWVARVIRRLVEFTQAGGVVNMVIPGVNVGGQSYWNAEATMLMHTRGVLIMTPGGSMVLTGKRALDYSGGVSADDNQGIGGVERIMGPNGQAQYAARDISHACQILFRYYEHTYVAPGERFPRRQPSEDPADRDIRPEPHTMPDGTGFATIGEVFSAEANPDRKKPFDIRSVMTAVLDKGQQPLERWAMMRNAENAVVWDAHLGGIPVCMVGIESRPLTRFGMVPGDGPDTWTAGTLFPLSSKKVARAINAASGNRPVVVLANLSGFDGSPESMRKLQLEYGAEIGRAVVNFDGPMVFCVISRYHGGAYVVFSRTLNDDLEVAALEGSFASVIGGAPAAAVVFPAEVRARALRDPRVVDLQQKLATANDQDKRRLRAQYDEVFRIVYAEKQGEVADHFDSVHSVHRAREVGSLQHIVPVSRLRPYLIEAVERGMSRVLARIGHNPVRNHGTHVRTRNLGRLHHDSAQ